VALFIEMVRTALYRRNEVGVQAPSEPCVRCGKPVLPQGAARLELLVGGEILPVGDPRSGSAASQGSFPIGPDCARALGSKYVMPYLKEETPPDVTAADRRCRDHRPGLGREWCYDDGEWCYKDQPCRGCTIVVLEARVTALEAAIKEEHRLHHAVAHESAMQICTPLCRLVAHGAGGTT